MKRFAAIATVAIIAALFSSTVLTQTPGGSAAGMGVNAGGPSAPQEASKAAPRKARRSREHADARECLQFPTNPEIIRCAEKYRNR